MTTGTAAERPIFVVGCPRSGTTLLQLMLHSHPRIAIPPETRFMLDIYERRLEFGDLADPANRRRLAEAITGPKATRFHELGLDAGEVSKLIADAPPTLGSALGTVLQAYAGRFGKPRWGDKRPAYVMHMDALRRLFPTAQFVHLVRDGRDCVASLKSMPWYHEDSHHAAATWSRAIDLGRKYARTMPAGSYHELRYEDLITRPEQELTALCGFLGEEFHPAMLQPDKAARIAVPGRKTWHTGTHEAVNAARAGTWRDRLDPWEISLCETVLAGGLRHHGYELTGAPRPDAALLLRYRRTAAERRGSLAKRILRDQLVRRREPGSVSYEFRPSLAS
jgi:hypothetical protein